MTRAYFVTVALLACALPLRADVLYQTDFSSDPSWTTNSSSNYYWDSTNERYFMRNYNNNSSYVHKEMPCSGGNFTLEFDLYPEDVQFDSHLNPGLSHDYTKASDTYPDSFARVVFGNGTPVGGNQWKFETHNGTALDWAAVEIDHWYNVTFDYDASATTLSFTMLKDGNPFASTTVSSITFVEPTYYFVNNDDRSHGGNASTGYLDNLTFTGSPVPEPSTAVLFIAGLAVAATRRNRGSRKR